MNSAEHVDHIVVLPLYPQFSCSTVGAVWDELARILARKRSIRGYRLYVITPITTITLMHWRTAYALLLPNMANRICYCSLIMAFPSVMQMKAMITRNVAAQRLVNWLPHWGWHRKSDDDLSVALWSGTTADALYRRNAENARRKRRRSYSGDVRGFAADCLETLEEIAEQNREVFLGAGGKNMNIFRRLMPRRNISK